MKAKVNVDAGICGFHTAITAECEDGMFVTLDVRSACEKMAGLAKALAEKGPINAFEEISPVGESVILTTLRPQGCCAACAAPIGAFKAMQVAAGLALPKDISMKMTKQ